jgi:hypothetical protein
MAGTINVDTLKADSNLRLQIASANVAFINASGMNIVGGNLIVGGTTITAAQLSQLNANGTISAAAIASVNANTITSGTIPVTQVPQLTSAKMPAGSVLQVVSTTMTDTASTSSGTFNDISGLSVSITPTSASSKILVLLNVTGGNNDGGAAVQLVRNSTAIAIATSATGSRINASFGNYYNNGDANSMRGHGLTHLDSPATASSVTYKAQFRVGQTSGGREFYVNRANGNDDATYNIRTVSTITVMEIAA